MVEGVERMLREKVEASGFCELRTGCEVKRLADLDDGTEVTYIDHNGSTKRIRTTWLIGADGKKGVVRKTFLEPLADIRQVESDYRYEGTWIAANLKISLSTPETHPDFPAWKLGMTPEEVYDLFWPKGWHFCSPPGKPTATGRFGPLESRLWRHEFRQENYSEQKTDAEDLLWEHLTPMISRKADSKGRRFDKTTTYPRDCIEVLRCRPFTFAHKVINKWHYKRNVLIGDAAHVVSRVLTQCFGLVFTNGDTQFPPFGGQGIASGLRDAHQLAWRIAILEKTPNASISRTEKILDAWATERAQSVKDAALFTKLNGQLCNYRRPLLLPVMKTVEWFWTSILGSQPPDIQDKSERRGYQGLSRGFFLHDYGGGRRLPQIYVNTLFESQVLSDSIFTAQDSPLRLLILHRDSQSPENGLKDLLSDVGVPEEILSPKSIIHMSITPCRPERTGPCAEPETRKVSPAPLRNLSEKEARPGYDVAAFENRLGKEARYVIVRPDFYVFAVARSLGELRGCLEGLKGMIGGDEGEKVESSI